MPPSSENDSPTHTVQIHILDNHHITLDSDTLDAIMTGHFSHSHHRVRVQPYSFRHILFLASTLLVFLSIPYLLLYTNHADQCYTTRPDSLLRHHNPTDLSSSTLNPEFLSATTPSAGALNNNDTAETLADVLPRNPVLAHSQPKQHPLIRAFHKYQTLIMLVLLACLLVNKILYAVWYYYPASFPAHHFHSTSLGPVEPLMTSPQPGGHTPSLSSPFVPVLEDSHFEEGSTVVGGKLPRLPSQSNSLSSTKRFPKSSDGSSRERSVPSTPASHTPPTMSRTLSSAASPFSNAGGSKSTAASYRSLTVINVNPSNNTSAAASPLLATHSMSLPNPSPQSQGFGGNPTNRFPFMWYEIFRLLYAYLFYLSSYFFCNALKSMLGDHMCSTHGNSVSGHYLFHLYTLWIIAYIHLNQKHLHLETMLTKRFWLRIIKHPNQQRIDQVFLAFYGFYAFVVSSILFDTYFSGYHTPRQIIYGGTLAAIVFLATTGVFESMEDRIAMYPGYIQAKGLDIQEPVAATPVALVHSSDASDSTATSTSITATSGKDKELIIIDPSLSVAYVPMVSSVLHEWFYKDEKKQRFYSFPIVVLILYQTFSIFLLLNSPDPEFFRAGDMGAVVVGYAALLWIWNYKLRLPPRRLIKRVQAHDVEA